MAAEPLRSDSVGGETAAMIVCSCNVLSDDAVRAVAGRDPDYPRTPAQIHRCLGLRPQCGTCFPTIRAILDQALPGGTSGGRS